MTENSRERDPFWTHPVLQDFLQQHENCSPANACRAFRVYLNLAEVRGWRDIHMRFCADLQMPFVTGRSNMGAALEVAYPVSMEHALSHQQIQTLFSALRLGDQHFDRIMLAICAADYSVVYYSVSNAIVKPEPPDASDARKQDWHLKAAKRKRLVAECVEHFSVTQRETTHRETEEESSP